MINILISASVAVLLSMTITWFIQNRSKNAGIVDVTWSYNFALIAIIAFYFGEGDFLRKSLITIIVCLWSLRLGTYLFKRNVGKTEDARYTQFRKDWGPNQNLWMLAFYYLQGILNLILCLPIYLVVINASPEISILEIIGCIIWLIAIIGEATADAQLAKYKSNPANKGGICNIGLWNYSRHPNYFFESMIWVGYAVFALASPNGYWALISPVMITYFLLKMTGIPATEAHMLRTRGAAFEAYMRSTSAFVPWFKK